MGTEIQLKRSFEGYYSMRDVNEDSNSSSWPPFYGDKSLINNSHHYNAFIPRTVADAYPGCDKDALKQKMLEHESIFKNQVYELHRLYRRQRDIMEEVKRKEYHSHRISIDTSSSSSHLPSQKPYEEGHKWQIPSLPLVNSCVRPSIFGADISNSPLSSKDCDNTESRPSKVRKKLFDLEQPPDDDIIDHEEHEESSYNKDALFGQCFRGSNGLADLNEPVHVNDVTGHGSRFLDPTREVFEKGQSGRSTLNPLLVEGKGNGRDWLSNTHETGTCTEISTKIQDHSRFNQTTPFSFPASRTNNSYPYMNSTDLGNSWGKTNGSLTQKLTSFQKQPSFLSYPQSHVVFGNKWRTNGCYTPNGLFHGSSSGSKDPCARLPSGGFDQQKIFKGSNFIDLTDTTKDVDLNNNGNSARKCGQNVLPSWLHPTSAIRKNDYLVNNGKILGFPVFGNSCVSKNDSSSLASTSASLRVPCENGKIKIENRGFDINVAWDDPANKQIETGTEIEKIEKIKNNFDLNSCLTEDEDFLIPEKVKKITMEIDLEALAVPEVEEEEIDESLARLAAEAIVAMTGLSSQQDEVANCCDDNERLLWLADVIENACFVSKEMDEFEELTLQLELTKEEDYMPKPLSLDLNEPDEVGPSTGPTRPRRGQARRGRPRRDFQRDILPGLVSLSRHEVTEDLQIFGGLMKATGHSWNVGPTRRNGTRGRRKSVAAAVVLPPPPPAATPPPPPPPPPPPLLEVVGLEERSLTGWGKTTRRPRRQRCAAGASVAVPLT